MSYESDATNLIMSESPMSALYYTNPIELGNRLYVGLGINFTKGSLTNAVIVMEVWDGAAFRQHYAADATTMWTLTLTANFDGTVHIGSQTADMEFNPGEILWPRVRFKVTTSGTVTGSSMDLRLASK